MNRSESKYFNTAQKMDEALIALLDEKDFAYITVKDICKAAGVNRSTFYLHYETVADLLEETQEFLNRQFQSYFSEDPQQFIPSISTMPQEELIFIQDRYLIPYLNYVRDNKNVFSVTFRQAGILKSSQRYESLWRYVIDPVMERFHVPQEKRVYYNKFFMSGILAIIQEWLKRGCREDPAEVSHLIEGLVLRQ